MYLQKYKDQHQNPQNVSLHMFYLQKMAKWAFKIQQNRSKLHNIQNLAAFWALYW